MILTLLRFTPALSLRRDVETKRINEAVKNNPGKFPEGYIIETTDDEWNALKSKISTLKSKQATETTIAIIETFAKVRELTQAINKLSQNPPKPEQQSLMQKSGEIMAKLLDDDLHTTGTETSIEINFAVLKFKHTIKKEK